MALHFFKRISKTNYTFSNESNIPLQKSQCKPKCNSKKNTTFVFNKVVSDSEKTSDREYVYSKLGRLIMLLKDW